MANKYQLNNLEGRRLYCKFIDDYDLDEFYHWVNYDIESSTIIIQIQEYSQLPLFTSKYIPFLYKSHPIYLQPY